MVEREVKNVKLISENPKLSGNQIYILSKKKGIGINKSKFYELVRAVRKLPEPTKEKKEKSIPLKYRKPGIVVKPPKPPEIELGFKKPIKPKSEYGFAEIIGQGTKRSYWIKYRNRKHLSEQLAKIEAAYRKKEKRFGFIDHGIITRQWKIDADFEKHLKAFMKLQMQF